ncbi:hypothetical protein [Moellerella wisconsensis]|uniref:hypothetical protein n=1 Tax=Moellerella wisconsensis TaxID=158849 RepID=UPI0006416A5E|nr:hypothetical protein [Moellerella wisconsensis]KLN98070.1 hypothetical protein VK86_01485 [Moellerella wisconsensis]
MTIKKTVFLITLLFSCASLQTMTAYAASSEVNSKISSSKYNMVEYQAIEYFTHLEKHGKTGIAQQSKPRFARLAKPGESVTLTADHGAQTTTVTAQKGDWIIETDCSPKATEQMLVSAKIFAEQYYDPITALTKPGYLRIIPRTLPVNYYPVPPNTPSFIITRDGKSPQIVKSGDVVIQSSREANDIHRLSMAEFICHYEIIAAAQ